MENEKKLTFQDLKKMNITERKTLAYKIIEKETLKSIKHIDKEWGRFEDFGKLEEPEIEKEALKILNSMSIEQKVNQMTPNTSVEEYIPACLKYNDMPYYAGEDVELNIPGIKFSDGPTGVVMGTESTCFPVTMARGATWDPLLEEEIGNVMGIEARSLGANLFGGVCINLLRHPSWGRSQETYGEDSFLLASMGTALVKGVQNHVMACIKHFALNTIENTRYRVNVEIDERTLYELYLPHFKACVDAGAASVMTAYNKFRNEYCGENPYLLRTILKKEWAFKGFVISDFLNGIYDGKRAVDAGLDIEMPITGYFGDDLVSLVKNNTIDESLIDDAVLRILRTKIKFSQIGTPSLYQKDTLSCKQHTEVAKKAALKSTVLLKNENQLLPLDRQSIKELVLIGSLAATQNIGDTKGSSHVYPPYVITPLEGIKNKLLDDNILHYFENTEQEGCLEAVSRADAVILVVGLTAKDEGEYIPHWNDYLGGDRTDLGLCDSDILTINKVARNTSRSIVVLQGGGAILTHPWDVKINSLLMTWYPGMEGGNALADIIFGNFNPCGKLPITIPKTDDQLPFFDKEALEIDYDYYHGYFLTDKQNYQVSYYFGFGLSYTTFLYSDLHITKYRLQKQELLEIEVTVVNSGKYEGEEVIQFYSGYVNSSVERHIKDLKGFCRVTLKPGESKRVKYSIPLSSLAYYDCNLQQWVTEKIEYKLYVGSSSRGKDLLTTSFVIE